MRLARPTGIALALLALHAALGVWHAWTTSATYDETSHVTSGYLSWRTGDFRLNPEHPPFVKRWATLPLLVLSPWPSAAALSDPDSLAPAGSDRRRLQDAWRLAAADFLQQWEVAPMFLYGTTDAVTARAGTDARHLPVEQRLSPSDFVNGGDRLVRIARLPMVLLSVGIGWLLFHWARACFGAPGALLALALYALDPNVIAHGSLVTTDVAIAGFLFATAYAWWRVGRALTPRGALAAVGWPVLAVITKLTAVVLVPTLLLWGAIRVASAAPWALPARWQHLAATRRGRLRIVGLLLATTAVAGIIGIWAAYDFRFSMSRAVAGETAPPAPPIAAALTATAHHQQLLETYPTGDFPAALAMTLPTDLPLGPGGDALAWMHAHRVLPEGFLFGAVIARLYGLRRLAFLDGAVSLRGFPGYFVTATLLKTPLATLLLIALGTLAWLRRGGWRDAGTAGAILVPVGMYVAMTYVGHLNIGYRHLLPLLPFGALLAAALADPWSRLPRRARMATALAGGAALVVSAQVTVADGRPHPVAPHFLSYFNALAGGPDGGRHHLVDSNLDWGQDLPALARWVRERSDDAPINLCYFGTADPRWYGIRFRNMPGCDGTLVPESRFVPRPGPLPPTIAPLAPSGWLVVSASYLSGTFFYGTDRQARWRDFLAVYATPVDTIAHSLLVYRLHRAAY